MLSRYKEWVKRHPGVVQNLDWLLLFTVWNPSRTNGGFEFTYEAYHAAVGLLSLWHQNILEEDELPTSRPAPYMWLDAIEHLETLIELRGMHLENQGKMSRYGPLLAVEVVKAILKMAAWSRYSGHVFLRRPTPDDLHQFESEQGMQDILASLDRLRGKYTTSSASASTSAAQPPLASGCGGGVQPGCALAPPGAAATLVSPSGCGAAAGGGGSGCAACSRSRSGGGDTYGLREYVGEWAATLVPQQLRRGAGGGGGGGGSGSCQKPSQPKDACATAATAAEEQQQQQCRVVSESGCSTSPRCGAAAVTARAEDCCCPGGESRWRRQQQQQQWQAARWQWGQQLQDAGVQAGWSPRPAGMGLGMRAAGVGEDPDAHMGRNLLWLSELLYIWRPVVYVTMLKRYGRRSWRPWATSLAVDLLSGHFHRRGRKHLAEAEARAEAEAVAAAAAAASDGGSDGDGGEVKAAAVAARMPALYGKGTSLLSLALARSLAAPGITAGEERELYDRRRKLALYLLRSPFLEATTLSWLAFLRDSTRKVPLLGFGADYLYGLVETFTAYYCYTSGSN